MNKIAAQLGGVDVAVIPYANRSFSKAKSAIAALEWTAAGVPWISTGNPEVALLDPTLGDLLDVVRVDLPAVRRPGYGR